jgi:hypothetical protein
MDLREIGLGVWIGLNWLKIATGGWLWWVRRWTLRFLRHGVGPHWLNIAVYLLLYFGSRYCSSMVCVYSTDTWTS